MKFNQISSSEILPHLVRINIGINRIWFSYETVIAFSTFKTLYISKNVWSATTGKHLNHINPDKSIRLNHDDFIDLYRTINLECL